VSKKRTPNINLPELALVELHQGLQREANQHYSDILFEKEFVDQLNN